MSETITTAVAEATQLLVAEHPRQYVNGHPHRCRCSECVTLRAAYLRWWRMERKGREFVEVPRQTLVTLISAAEGLLPTVDGGCCCTPFSQSAGGVYTEYLAEYDPACPEHSEHVYNPRSGVWEHAPSTEAKINAEVLREAAIMGAVQFAKDHHGESAWILGRALIDQSWLLAYADRIESEAGQR